MDRDQLNAFVGRTRSVIEALAGALLDAGRLAEAEHALASLSGAESIPLDNAERSLLEREQDLETRWRANIEDRVTLLRDNPTISSRPSDPQLVATLGEVKPHFRDAEADERMLTLDREFHDLMAEADRIDAPQFESLLERAPTFAAADQARLDATLGSLKALAGTTQIRYLAMDRRLRILVVSGRGRQLRDVDVGRTQLDRVVGDFRALLADRRSEPRDTARLLYRWLIQPIEADLARDHAHTLLLAPDGTLRYLPFAALHDGNQWLVERFALSVDASATSLARAPRAAGSAPASRWRIAGFGSTRAVDGLDPLPAVAQELRAVVRDTTGTTDGALSGVALLDSRFTAASLHAALAQHYPVVHIASHFMLLRPDKGDSYLVLGDGNRLTLPELRKDFRLDGVELLTLSACNTALDLHDAYGQEFEGIGAMLRNQGAAAVLATMWSVNDASTGLFMQHFYREHERSHLSRSEALRATQMFFIGGAHGSPADPTRRGAEVVNVEVTAPDAARSQVADAGGYAHPFYWAPFTLFGDWW